jgi:hypothetical protein
MNKIPHYGKHLNGPYPYNNPHANYNGNFNPYKKNYFKTRPKSGNIQINNNYFENPNKNYYYNYSFNPFNNSFSNFNENKNSYHSSIFQKNRNWHRYNQYFTEEKKIAEEISNDSVNDEEKPEEVLKIKINVSDSQSKELILCKNDDVNEKVLEFCKDNNISENLVKPLVNKVNQSLNTLELINNMALNKNDFEILDKAKNISDNDKNN